MTDNARIVRETLEQMSHHRTCEDPWYSCPESEEGCANDFNSGCTCGAASAIEALPALTAIETELATTKADLARAREEMKRHLPILEALERSPFLWSSYTDGTGIATLNGYRAALAPEQKGE